MISRLRVDQDHSVWGDDRTIPVDLGDSLSGQTHGTDSVISAGLLDNGIDVGDCLLFKAGGPGVADIRVVLLDVFVCSILPCLSFLCRERPNA